MGRKGSAVHKTPVNGHDVSEGQLSRGEWGRVCVRGGGAVPAHSPRRGLPGASSVEPNTEPFAACGAPRPPAPATFTSVRQHRRQHQRPCPPAAPAGAPAPTSRASHARKRQPRPLAAAPAAHVTASHRQRQPRPPEPPPPPSGPATPEAPAAPASGSASRARHR